MEPTHIIFGLLLYVKHLFLPVVILAPLEPVVSEFGQVWILGVTAQCFAVSALNHLVVEIAPFVPGIVAVLFLFQLAPVVAGLLWCG